MCGIPPAPRLNVSTTTGVLIGRASTSRQVDSYDPLPVQKQTAKPFPSETADSHRDLNANGSIDSVDVLTTLKKNPTVLPVFS